MSDDRLSADTQPFIAERHRCGNADFGYIVGRNLVLKTRGTDGTVGSAEFFSLLDGHPRAGEDADGVLVRQPRTRARW